MRYATGTDERGREIDVRDPLASRIRLIATAAGNSPGAIAEGLLGTTEVFGDDLPRNDSFRCALIRHLSSLIDRGALATVRNVNEIAHTMAHKI
jgi:fructuronate reductase